VSAASPAAPAPPTTFTAPWQLRTYVIASALAQQDVVDASTLAAGGDDPLRAWLATVQRALVERGLVTDEDLESAMAQQVAAAAARNVH
jgi:hypothetical protein